MSDGRFRYMLKYRKYPPYLGIGQIWASAHEGKFWKRLLHKARRRAWRSEGHERGLAGIESTVNWKNW